MKIGCIGCGNMGKAMLRGILEAKAVSAEEIMASTKTGESRERIRAELGIRTGTNEECAAFADLLLLAVKPQFYQEVIGQIRDYVRPQTLVVSIAPGKSLGWLKEQFARDLPLVRMMPNTPAMVGEGMTGVCPGENVSQEQLEQVLRLCGCFGRAGVVPERLMDVVTGISGSSPAYVFLFLEALADGAVAEGMPRAQAYEFAAQAVLGSAKMVLESGLHPGVLKDMVCSPAGTTIEAVNVLEEGGLRGLVMKAERTCVRRSRQM